MIYLLVCDKCGNDHGCISTSEEKRCVNCSLNWLCKLRSQMDYYGVHHEIRGICDECFYDALNR